MTELTDNQQKIVSDILKRNNLLVVSPADSEKILAVLAALETIIEREKRKNILIVSENDWVKKSVDYDIRLNIRFCRKFDDMHYFLCEDAAHRICICSIKLISKIPNGCWDVVVIDDIDMLFASSKQIKEIDRITKGVPRRILLSGTPVCRDYINLF